MRSNNSKHKNKYPLTNDIVFKKLFGEDKEETKQSLIFLINGILNLKDTAKINKITIMNPYTFSDIDTKEKRAVLDVKATCENGRKFNVEMQVNTEHYYSKRALYYWSKLYIETLEKGQSYDKLTKTIGIHILDFQYYEGNNFHKKHHMYYDNENGTNIHSFDEIEMHTIELPKLKHSTNSKTKILDTVEAIATFLTDPDFLTKNRDKLSKEDYTQFTSLTERYEEIHFSKQERYAIEDRLKAQFDEATNIAISKKIKKERDDAVKQKNDAVKQLNITKEEKDAAMKLLNIAKEEKINIVRNLLPINMDITNISNITGLTIKEIEEIKGSIKK